VKHKSLIAVACWIALVPARAAEGVVTYKSLAPRCRFRSGAVGIAAM
jgi:hypothetical protein